MKERIIRFCYRKLVDASTPGLWESHVFEDSYKEFLMQAQYYNQENKYSSFAQLLHHVKGADQLHFLVSSAVVGYLQQLANVIPDITNALGKTFLPFSNFRFEMVNSDVRDKGRHQIAINFYSDEVYWLDTIGTQLVISLAKAEPGKEWRTELVTLQPYFSIYSLQEKH